MFRAEEEDGEGRESYPVKNSLRGFDSNTGAIRPLPSGRLGERHIDVELIRYLTGQWCAILKHCIPNVVVLSSSYTSILLETRTVKSWYLCPSMYPIIIAKAMEPFPVCLLLPSHSDAYPNIYITTSFPPSTTCIHPFRRNHLSAGQTSHKSTTYIYIKNDVPPHPTTTAAQWKLQLAAMSG